LPSTEANRDLIVACGKLRSRAALQEARREIVEHRAALSARLQEQTDAVNNAEADLTIAHNHQDETLVRQRERERKESRTRLSIAIADLEASDKDVRAIDARIREVQGY
jgi:hypothetical protein